jgi:hypothetical protein
MLLVACLPPKLEPSDASATGDDEIAVVEASIEAPQGGSEPTPDACMPKCDSRICDVDDGCGKTCGCPGGIPCLNGVCPLN